MNKVWAKLIKGATFFLTLLIASILLNKSLVFPVFAQSPQTPPTFPACAEKIFSQEGDWAHYDFGVHGIPGVGNLEGSDDVYSLASGNFLQCFCPSQGFDGLPASKAGIQSNWWNIQRFGLSQEEIDEFLQQGWLFEPSGSGWNLFDEKYLFKNESFSCAETTPTPPTNPPELSKPGPPVCAAPAVTVAPLYSTGNLSRIDNDSIKITWIVTDGHAQKYGIHYGTSPDKLSWYTEVTGHETNEAVINSVPQGNIYFKVCSIGECGGTICGSNIPTVLGATTELPSTGTMTLILLGFAPIGYYLYKRFKLL